MPTERLRETLRELRAELARSDAGDPATRENVQATALEIDAWLERPEPTEDSWSDRLRVGVARFEKEHPHLAATLQRVVDALVDLGI